MRHKYSACALIILLVCGIAMMAQAKPNFTGEWKMDASKSDFGPFPAPYSYTRKIEHHEPTIKTVTTQSSQRGESTTETTYTTDGQECVNELPFGPVKGTAQWDGDTLVTKATMDFRGTQINYEEKMTLSEDGKTLTVAGHLSSDQGEADITIVLDKQ